MTLLKRIIMMISIILCVTIIWIPIHFGLKTLLYGDRRELKAKEIKANS